MSARFAESVHGRVTAWVVLAVSVLMTLLAWRAAERYQADDARGRFEAAVDATQLRIVERLRNYELVLRTGAGLFAASHEVTGNEWRAFIGRIDLQRSYPGLQGLGYAQLTAPPQPQAAEGRSAIVYLEPPDWRNQRALGYDMLSEPVRQSAMARARDEGGAALSGRVTLLQETGEDVQHGTLMYWPVYRSGAPLDSVAARRAALQGWVYAPFRMRDLMDGILPAQGQQVAFTLYDGDRADPAHRLVGSGTAQPDTRYRAQRQMLIAGAVWTVDFSATPAFEDAAHSVQPALIGLGGLLADLLLFGALHALARNGRLLAERNLELQRSREALSREQAALRERERRYRGVVESTREGFLMADQQGRITEVNDAYLSLSGFPREALIGQPIGSVDAQLDTAALKDITRRVQLHGHLRFETLHRRAEGPPWPVEVSLSLQAEDGAVFAFVHDLAELKRLEAERQQATEQIRRMAFHDALTQLPNRRLLLDRLSQALSAARRTQHHGALLFIDLDHFKALNDAHGHAAGDQVLVQCAQRLQACTRAEDTVARLGGDEFVLMMASGLPEDPTDALTQVRVVADKLLATLDLPYDVAGTQHHCSPSIGATLFRDQSDAEEVLRQADDAMYRAKREGRRALRFAAL
ncbi:diguanylate cyclase [Ideonella sp. 4Y11]|uniref:Diguanylate cyclase n=1 Tax=Ideonella aquatica TaxID=2824119 RepID=A0A940YKN5_9BURK|nr:CHASE domain-containing protein [Ideonella aquatica]MBQ0957773.1 diguanylate cyclase [Ideonella aquatica]